MAVAMTRATAGERKSPRFPGPYQIAACCSPVYACSPDGVHTRTSSVPNRVV